MNLRSPRRLRWRRHGTVAVGAPLALALLVVTFGSSRVRALSSSERLGRHRRAATVVPAGQTDLFDVTRVHTVELHYDAADAHRMFDTYFDEGDKAWMPADVTIDGITIRNVGIRLKGNATLSNLRSADGRAAPRSFGPPGGFPGGAGGFPGGAGGLPGGGGFPGGGFGTPLSAEEPEGLPWLVRFDAFVSDQRYQGHRELALRVAQFGTTATVLNEAVSQRLLADAGDPGAAATYVALRVNGGTAKLRLVVENPDEAVAAEDFAGDGALYKSLASGRFTYQGEDPLKYTTSFRQLTARKRFDLQPVIDLVRWANEADDVEFVAELDEHLDVEAFARYVAWQNLLVNFDDMAGPGQNYLLWFDARAGRFTVATWDMNSALGSNTSQGPYQSGGFPGGGFPGGGFPAPPAGAGPAGAGPAGAVAGFRLGGHRLKERFLAAEAFHPVYERAYRELYATYFAGGRAAEIVDQLAGLLSRSAPDGTDAARVVQDVAGVRRFVEERTAALANDPVITG